MPARVKHQEEEGGEGYFASVSDLMVGILFIFLLMLTVFALNFHDEQQIALEKYEELSKEAQRAKDEALVAEAQAAKQQDINQKLRTLLEQAMDQLQRDMMERQKARGELLTSLQQSLRDRNIRVTIDPTSGILRLSGDLLFDKGQFDLKSEAQQTIMVLADVLAHTLGCYSEGGQRDNCAAEAKPILDSVLVEGHTDRQPFANVPIGESEGKNDRLSTDRALTVFKQLRQFQPGLDALKNGGQQPLMAFSGYGQRRPLPDALGDKEPDYQRNRRIDLRFVLSERTSDELNRLREQITQILEQP